MITPILLSVLRDAWAIDPLEAKPYMALLHNQLTGTVQTERATPEELKAFGPTLSLYNGKILLLEEPIAKGASSAAHNQPANKEHRYVATIPISGALTKDDQICGPRGMETISSWIDSLNSNPYVSAIVLKMDTPGGQVSGTQLLATSIKNASKPVIAFINDGMIASAGYWIASACDKIVSSHATNRIGSIGVYMQAPDMVSYWKAQGLEIHTVFSSLSGEKNKDILEVFQGKYEAIQKNHLDPLANAFINTVKANRPGIDTSKADPFKGAMFFSEQAIEIGLIDQMGSLQEAIELALDLAEERSQGQASAAENPPTLHVNSDSMKIAATNTALIAFLGLTVAEGATEVDFNPTAAELEALNARLVADAETEAEEQRVQDATVADRDHWKAKAEEYGKAAGVYPAAQPKAADPIKPKEEESLTEVDLQVAEMRKQMGLDPQ